MDTTLYQTIVNISDPHRVGKNKPLVYAYPRCCTFRALLANEMELNW